MSDILSSLSEGVEAESEGDAFTWAGLGLG